MAATATLVSLEEYLHTSYKPDCDFVDGHLEERHVGEYPHSKCTGELYFWFRLHTAEWKINPLVEQRVQVSANHARVCDICLLDAEAEHEAVTTRPPLVVIEILSPEDRISRATLVLEDYRQMGVKTIWLLDPVHRFAMAYTEDGLGAPVTERLEIAGSPIYLDLPELFKALD